MKRLLRGGTVYPMTGEYDFLKGDVLVENGKIACVAPRINAPDAEIMDCRGLTVLPGLIDAHCHIGLFGTAMGDRGVDGNEISAACTPELRAIDAINPFDDEFAYSYRHGVTTVSTGPGSANPICGQFVTLRTYGESLDDRIIRQPSAMKMAFGENPKCAHNGQAPLTRMGTAAIIRKALTAAARYRQDKERALAEGKPLPPVDMQAEALIPVLDGTLPVKAHAHRADDILTALRIAKEFQLDMSIEHCSEGQFILEELKAAHGVIIGPLTGFPHKLEVKNQTPATACALYEKGIRFAIMSDLPATHTDGIIMAAGMCIREGLPPMEALKSVTISAAEILKIDSLVGSLEAGKDADIAVFSANPMQEVAARCVLTLGRGRVLYDERGKI